MDRRSALLLLGSALVFAAQVSAQLALTGTQTATVAAPQGAAVTNDPCAVSVNFFPVNYEDSNTPAGWTQSVQSNAGNARKDQLIKIALAGYPLPSLNVAPDSVFTRVGGQMPASCAGGAATGAAILAVPAQFTISWELAGQSGVLGPYTKGDKTDPPANITLPFVPNLPDGNYCLNLKLDLVPGSGVAAIGASQVRVPAAAAGAIRQVCFIKVNQRPSTNVTFRSCNDSFAVDLASVQPPPIFARYPDIQMFSTVFHVWGKLNKTFTAGQDTEGKLDYFDQYVKWSDPNQPPFLQVYMESPGLIDGYYNVWIEGSLSTAYPELVNLFGADTYDDGSAKFMGVSLRNTSNKPVPIQTTKSKIENLAGPDGMVGTGGLATFQWDTLGYGEQFCYVDGAKISNTADRVHCEAPLSLAIKDNANHTLEVVLSDVCGDVVANGLYFGSWGWALNPKYTPPAPSPVAELPIGAAPALALPRTPMATMNLTDESGAGNVLPTLAATLGSAAVGLAALLL